MNPSPSYVRSYKADQIELQVFCFSLAKASNDSKRGFPQTKIPLHPNGAPKMERSRGKRPGGHLLSGWFKQMQAGVLESKGFCRWQHMASKHRNNQKVPPSPRHVACLPSPEGWSAVQAFSHFLLLKRVTINLPSQKIWEKEPLSQRHGLCSSH